MSIFIISSVKLLSYVIKLQIFDLVLHHDIHLVNHNMLVKTLFLLNTDQNEREVLKNPILVVVEEFLQQ